MLQAAVSLLQAWGSTRHSLRPTSSTLLTTAYAICSSNVLTSYGTVRSDRCHSARRDPPTSSAPLFPVCPAPAMIDQPSAPISLPPAAVTKPGETELEPPDPQLYSNLELFDPALLTRDEKFQLVAEHGAPILLRRDFVPAQRL